MLRTADPPPAAMSSAWFAPRATSGYRCLQRGSRTACARATQISVAHENDAAVAIETEPDLGEPFAFHGLPECPRVTRVEQQEPSGARADELPSDRTAVAA